MKKMKKILATSIFLLLLFSCDNSSNSETPKFEYVERTPIFDSTFVVQADAETEPVEASSSSDAADDPAIWIHPSDPAKSIIYGSNKKGGIVAYNLSGNKLIYAPVGAINNIDVAYNLKLKNETIDVCGGTNRTINAIDIYKINNTTGELEYILDSATKSKVNEVYGFCFYNSPISSTNYAILCGKNGVVEHYEIEEGNEKLSLKLVSSYDIGGQPEGMVADHKHGILYIGEEDNCIWKINAEPGTHTPQKIAFTSESDNKNIEYDIEGLTIYYTSSENGYLIASSQGNNTYAIFDRHYDNKYIGSFKIGDGTLDGTTETDGIDVINLNLGGVFESGMFIAQDDKNLENGTVLPQNFKMMSWAKVANLFNPPLYIDSDFNVRSFFE